ncbi:NADP-dependent fatty aldehyde dehydrogenase [Planctomycetes bacterium Pan216]|uniref:NADP-dependent fatty aldehyde dehydrogenase n=1 Tax=Kolteria novifilia TaxID=2527975 RepID=A0A518BCP8_9BACT|nr:NADP-dependent fatty aldehyde dehydrogenase [Planctomycetes bacterium Pan216]
MPIYPILLAGQWKQSSSEHTFEAINPKTRQPIPDGYPVSPWQEVDQALDAAADAAEQLRKLAPERIAAFLERFAERIEAKAEPICDLANQETALPVAPRLMDVELPRTANQLRLAAAACRDGSWALPTIDTKANIRSIHASIGPVAVFGPNNFPLAFNGVAGGDFAAAIAAGNPVIAKANSSHPGTTRLLAEEAFEALKETDLPLATVQLLYRLDHADGAKLVADPRLGATGYTGSRKAGVMLKTAADAVGKPIYLEMSSVNPVVILPGAIKDHPQEIAEQFLTSCLMGTGQFCTNPGLVLVIAGRETETFLVDLKDRFSAAPVGTLLGPATESSLIASIAKLKETGATLLCGGTVGVGEGCSVANTLLQSSAQLFLAHAEAFQTEAFGNASLVVVAQDIDELVAVARHLEGNLTGTIYSHPDGADDGLYAQIEPVLRQKVGRLLNDKMPTGVAVSPAMNHGGPFPATGHPGFTAVGIPASLRRFSALYCYDNIRPDRLPPILQDKNPSTTWRLLDTTWSQADVG